MAVKFKPIGENLTRINASMNKKMKILVDVDKRQLTLQEQAIQRFLMRDASNPHLPQIDNASASIRHSCYECGAAFWGHQNEDYCPTCKERNEKMRAILMEIAAMENEIKLVELEEQLEKTRKKVEEKQAYRAAVRN